MKATAPRPRRSEPVSRRAFVASSGLALVGLALQTPTSAADEPIIDIHQHLGYRAVRRGLPGPPARDGGDDDHLLPAGRPVSTPSTHDGVSNGLEAKCLGNEACHAFARRTSGSLPVRAPTRCRTSTGAATEIDRYLRRGAVMIAEQKFGVECDSPEMQRIYSWPRPTTCRC